jgi:hypothetical protein
MAGVEYFFLPWEMLLIAVPVAPESEFCVRIAGGA